MKRQQVRSQDRNMFDRVVQSEPCRKTGISERKLKLLLYISTILILLYILSPGAKAEVSPSGYTSHGTVRLSELIGASIALSELAGLTIKQVKEAHKEKTKIKGMTLEGVAEPVTVADEKSNSVFINGFHQFFPGLTLVSEETEPLKEKIAIEFEPAKLKQDVTYNLNELIVIVDPLDATKEFTEEYDVDGSWMLNFVTTLVCIVKDDKPIVGIINRPFMEKEKVMYGIVPTGEVVNLTPIPAKGENANKVTVSRSHAGDAKDVVKKYFFPKVSLPAGGAGYKSWLVLTGAADAYIHTTKIKIWDLCAGHAMIAAAGGDVVDRDGAKLSYREDSPVFSNGLVASLSRTKVKNYVRDLKAGPTK